MRLLLLQPTLSFNDRDKHYEDATELAARQRPGEQDVLLLPEHFESSMDQAEYETRVSQLAKTLGCYVVGGSQHCVRDGEDKPVNRGVTCDPSGTIIGQYEKIRPYATERTFVAPGTSHGLIDIAGKRCLVLICADFWFTDLLLATAELPDVILVPALSVSRKPEPRFSQEMWRHIAVARAYEFGCFIGVSDWSEKSRLPQLAASGVAGFADPSQADPDRLFQPLADDPCRVFDLDFAALEGFRADRKARGFFWSPGE